MMRMVTNPKRPSKPTATTGATVYFDMIFSAITEQKFPTNGVFQSETRIKRSLRKYEVTFDDHLSCRAT